jgi:sulfur-oxidizing protein SoxZ
MSNPTRIRAQVVGGKAIVRVLMSHDMESGQRKDAVGKLIPAWHITEVTVTHNGHPVLTAEWGPGVSRNPFLQLVVKDAQVGDKLGVFWKDNRGDSRAEEASFA